MKGSFVAISAALLVSQTLFLVSNGQELVNGKVKPDQRQLDRIWRLLMNTMKHVDNQFGPHLLRLAFHQCVGTSCNGCVDPTDPENKGFERAIGHLEKLHQHPDIFPYMTMSDLISFGVMPLIHHGILMNDLNCRHCHRCALPTPKYEFWWGRKDECDNIYTKVNNTPNGFPSLKMSRADMMAFFKNDFNFTEEEALILLGGAHAMGRAHLNVSGYHGDFMKPGQYGRVFNNRVFRLLTSKQHVFKYIANSPDDATDKSYQVEAFGTGGAWKGMLLNAEVVAAFDVELNPMTDLQCKINDRIFHKHGEEPMDPYPDYPLCNKSALWDLAYQYAHDEKKFIDDFFAILIKMLNHGNEGKLEKLPMPYFKHKTDDDFKYVKNSGHKCYPAADKEWENKTRIKMEKGLEEVKISRKEASEAIEEANEAIMEALDNQVENKKMEEANKAFKHAKKALEEFDVMIEEANKMVEEAIHMVVGEGSNPSKLHKRKLGTHQAKEAIEKVTKANLVAKRAKKEAEKAKKKAEEATL